eukprot:TRINITY_DN10141_c0_g1_i2.p1 TRINITY_DN10141_c0_g1~~TRINITY_DN10141_c0_g1_i2.p1  ORF type:complete len:1056 (+),score=288.60 TRINITY_DN10141_c0_g1_i2:31-3168(+)
MDDNLLLQDVKEEQRISLNSRHCGTVSYGSGWYSKSESDFDTERKRQNTLRTTDREESYQPCVLSANNLGGAAVLHSDTVVAGNEYIKKAYQHALLQIETLSRTQSQMLITVLYLTILICTVASIVDYVYMWECTNICYSSTHTPTTRMTCGVEDSHECMDVQEDTVTWEGRIDGLSPLNRFMHMTFMMDNPYANSSNSSFSLTQLHFQQIAYTSGDKPPYNSSFILTLSCSFNQQRCSTLQLPVTDLPWSDAYNTSIILLDPPPQFADYLNTVSIIFQYQNSIYTLVELACRLAMVAYTLVRLIIFVRTLGAQHVRHWLTEQQYILGGYLFLFLYLDPFYPLATYDTRSTSNRGIWAVIQFVEFHCSTYFFLYIQVMVVVLLTSVRRTDGKVTTATHVSVFVWFVIMVSLDITVAVKDKDTTSDYSSTFLWYLFTHNIEDGFAVFMFTSAALCQLGWAAWTIRGVFRTAKKLKTQPYFVTRHRQLAFRYLIFLFGGFIFYQTLTAAISWVMHDGFSITYRSTQEIGAVVLAFMLLHLIAYIYLPAFVDPNAPPAPCYPNWRNAKWKSIRWRSEWYVWLARHGGSLYFFIEKEEQDRYLQAQRSSESVKGEEKSVHRRFSVHTVMHSAFWLGEQVKERLISEPLRSLQDALFSEGYIGCPRLFFCLEISTQMLNLSYRVYYSPSIADRIDTTKGPKGNYSLRQAVNVQPPCIASLAICASVCCAALTDDSADEPTSPSSPAKAEKKKFFNRSSSPSKRDRMSQGVYAPLKEIERPDLARYGYHLFDCIEIASCQVFVTLPINEFGTTEGADHVVVVFRGTWNKENANTDLKVLRKPWPEMQAGDESFACADCTTLPLLHTGFMELWSELKDAVLESLQEAIGVLSSHPTVYITGHSLGGAMACLCAFSVSVQLELLPVVYTFGCPKLGNRAFQRRYNATVPNTFRVVNEHDFVAHWSVTWSNFHVGHEVCIGKGNLLVEPTWIEQTFQPTKRGASKIASHSLMKYAQALNSICDRYKVMRQCLPDDDWYEVSELQDYADFGEAGV